MTLTLPARHRTGTSRCMADTGFRYTEAGRVPLQCHQSVGLRREGAAAYCVAPGHRERALAKAARHG